MDNLVCDSCDAVEDLIHVVFQCSVAGLLFNAIGYVGVFESFEDIHVFIFQNHSLHHKALVAYCG